MQSSFYKTIENVPFTDEALYNIVQELIRQMNEQFNIQIHSQKFVEDFTHVIETVFNEYEYVTFFDIELEFSAAIHFCDKLEYLFFDIYGDDSKFEWFNDNLLYNRYQL